MKFVIGVLFVIISCGLQAQITFDNYANIHAVGVGFKTNTSDPENDLSIKLKYKVSTSNIWLDGMEFVQANTYNTNLYNSSIFYCQPATTYYVKVILEDLTTTALNGGFIDTINTQSLALISALNTTYFVSNTGNGTDFSQFNPGNFSDALALVQAGDKIVLLDGTYKMGAYNFTQSGTEQAPIVIEGIEGGNIIIDGSDFVSAWETDPSVNGFKASIDNPNCNVVIADGIRLYPHKSLKELKYNKIPWESECRDAGVDGFFRSGNSNTLRLKFRDNSDPNLKDIKVGKYNYFMELNGAENIRFANINFKYFGSKGLGAIVLKNASNIRFDACKFEYNDIGVLLKESSNNLIINECEFSDAYGNWNFWRMKASYEGSYLIGCSGNNIISDLANGSNVVNTGNFRSLEKGGVFVSGDYSGRGMVIRKSSFHDMVQGLSIRPQSWWTDASGKTAEIDFYENTVYNCSEDGLESDVYPRNVRIWKNVFHNVNASISLASGADGPVYVFRNTFYDLTTDTSWISSFGNYTPGRPLKINSGNSGTGLDNTGALYFLHNTVFAQNNHYAMDLLKPSNQVWNKITMLNNVLKAENQYAMRVRATNFGNFVSDYNNIYNNQVDLITYDNSVFASIETFTNQLGYDEHSISTNALFTDVINRDFSLTEGSPNIDAGVEINGLNSGFLGSAPDIGAIEFETVMGVSEQFSDLNVKLYPNPASLFTELIINGFNDSEKGLIEIVSLEGKTLLKQVISNKVTVLDLNSLKTGVYIVLVSSGKYKRSLKLIKQ